MRVFDEARASEGRAAMEGYTCAGGVVVGFYERAEVGQERLYAVVLGLLFHWLLLVWEI